MIPVEEKINLYIKENKLNRQKTADIAGVPKTTLDNLLQGQTKNVSLRMALSLAKAFNISVYELIKDTEYEI